MENIARPCGKRRGLSSVLSLVRALPKVSARKAAVVVIPLCLLAAAGTVMLNLKHITIISPDRSESISTFKTSPAEILAQQGITASPHDKIVFSGFKNNNATLKIIPAFKVSVLADAKTTELSVTDGTVADVLKKAGVEVGTDDLVNVPLGTAVKANDVITVRRVTFETRTSYQAIPYTTVKQTSTLYKKGTQKVLNSGQEGKKEITTRVKYIDGKKTEEVSVKESIVKKPVTRTLLVGTAARTPVSSLVPPSSLKLDANGVPVGYSRAYTGKATAYTARDGARTSSGRYAGVGYIAVDPSKIPYGSKLYIMSPNGKFVYGYAIAADTGAFVHNGSGILTDLYFSTMAECRAFGAKKVTIYVLR